MPETLPERELFRKARRLATNLPFIRHVLAIWYAVIDPDVPVAGKARLAFAISYFLMPFDVVPDFFVGIGYVDDLAVIMATVRALGGMITDAHYARADARLAEWRASISLTSFASPG